jgi:hypothetical protein
LPASRFLAVASLARTNSTVKLCASISASVQPLALPGVARARGGDRAWEGGLR